MSKTAKKKPNVPKKVESHKDFKYIRTVKGAHEYILKANGMRVLIKSLPKTGVITSNILYFVGARDEIPGETGLAHMLEHMLFKPTKNDLKKKIDSGAMQFERETGCVLNANTWKDRTTYFFSYPKQFLGQALAIEADRMQNVVLSDKEFLPERGNVLSEFDMYFGDPEFALAVSMVGSAFNNHPYGHETIGTREDIEDYTVEKLQRFYQRFYQPSNAMLMVVGDCTIKDSLDQIAKSFKGLKNKAVVTPTVIAREAKQEGKREISISRPSTSNVLALGFKHKGLPTKDWFTTMLALEILAGGPESILHKLLIDTGKASQIYYFIEPTSDTNLAIIYVTLAAGQSHSGIELEIESAIKRTKLTSIKPLLESTVANLITERSFETASSLGFIRAITEYAAAGDWTEYYKAEKIYSSCTAADIKKTFDTLFAASNRTTGKFVATKN